MRVEHQVRAFEQILKSYDGQLPLHRFLFAYFKQNKQMGSSDRRWASRYVYNFFRLGNAMIKEEQLLRLAVGDFLCSQTPSLVIDTYLEKFKTNVGDPLTDKLRLIEEHFPTFKLEDVFSFKARVSPSIDQNAFYTSFFTQPDLFIRVNPDHLKSVIASLDESAVSFHKVSAYTLALPNGTKLEQVLPDQQCYQVQDLSSQKTGDFFKPEQWDYWWDCCAASGGKSLLLHGLQPQIQLLVSDVRENSLNNLEERFRVAGIKKYQKKVLDLLQNNDQTLHHYEFDGIILDAPCTGSGTWGRTPELLYYFDESRVNFFANLQKTIASNVVKYLKEGKPLIYITCSVFTAENEEVVAWLTENLPLKVEKMEVIKGYDEKADTMFAARLIRI